MLHLIQNFFDDCNTAELDFSIWKSLENIEEQLSGVGDLDVVFNPAQRQNIFDMLHRHHFMFDLGSPASAGDDVLVYRGFDEPSGKFVSMHVHFACRFGSKTHKECRYANEQEMFKSHVSYKGIDILCDGHFFAVRLLAASVRETATDEFVAVIAKRYFSDLGLSDKYILETKLRKYFKCEPEILLQQVQEQGAAALHAYRETVEASLDEDEPRSKYRDHVNSIVKPISWKRKIAIRLGLGRNKLNKPAEIVITGPDGAGKSTVCDLLIERLSKVGPTKVIYLGRKEWSKPNMLINTLRLKPYLSLLFGPVWPVSSMIELLLRRWKGWMLSKLGFFVLYDRCLYDSMIKFDQGYGLSGYFTKKISATYAMMHGDVQVFLFADPQVAISRKPPGKYDLEYLTEMTKKFEQALPESYIRMDSSERTAEDIANEIVKTYFISATSWAGRI